MAKKPTEPKKPAEPKKFAEPKNKKAEPATSYSVRAVDAIRHADARRKNIPTAEYQSVVGKPDRAPTRVAYPRNKDLDPQLMWRGKDEQNWSDLVVHAPPLYIQEKIHPKVLVDDLLRQTRASNRPSGQQADLFADFNGIPEGADKTDFYRHDQNWSNRMILGDSLQVMASLVEREGLRGKVQCIYLDPPYGIKFNSNFQWSTTSRDVKDGNAGHITREPEQVKAFRDTWRDGIHSYLTYLRDRLIVARDLLHESGSIFVQIGDENVHRVRALMDEAFGEANFVNTIVFKKKSATYSTETVFDYLLWYSKSRDRLKVRELFNARSSPEEETKFNTIVLPDGTIRNVSRLSGDAAAHLIAQGGRWARVNYPIVSQHPSERRSADYQYRGLRKRCGSNKQWRFDPETQMPRLEKAQRLFDGGGDSLGGVVFWDDWNQVAQANIWSDIHGEKYPTYVVQTAVAAVQRCTLMTTDPGDLVLDPTCGAGTTATVAEHWGRRWIAIDTSRVALALARARIMGARYPYYLLSDTKEGQAKEAEVTRSNPSSLPAHGNIRHGFVYERVPRVTLKSVANNAEIDVIWDKWHAELEPQRTALGKALKKDLSEWEIPREADANWSDAAKKAHEAWCVARVARQNEIDASIAAKAEYEYLYDKPYEDKKRVRVAGPFTVESISPHRVLGVDEHDELIDTLREPKAGYGEAQSFAQMILENLKAAGVQQAHKQDKITFTALTQWPGHYICADGRYLETGSETEKRAAIFVGPEFGTVTRTDLVEAAREAGDGNFHVLIACAFNFEAHTTEFNKLGRIPVLKARMNADLHMSEDLKNTGKGNLFVVFGEPDIELATTPEGLFQVKVRGVDVFHPATGEVRSDGPDGIACWFLDTDYNQESFFVRHAYFLGANDPYGALRTTLKAEINQEAWESLRSDTSRPFPKPQSGRIAVKIINHLGDEVMKVYKLS
jgi:adenine-specific DNA-methyltransferase